MLSGSKNYMFFYVFYLRAAEVCPRYYQHQ